LEELVTADARRLTDDEARQTTKGHSRVYEKKKLLLRAPQPSWFF